MSLKIISGGQTGADVGGLAGAKACGVETGGWMPEGWRTDEGPRPEYKDLYGMKVTTDWRYPPRTRLNVEESDGTVLFGNVNSPGCKLTLKYCHTLHKPDPLVNPTPEELWEWIEELGISTLNVAGNRERTNPGIFAKTRSRIIETLRLFGYKERK